MLLDVAEIRRVRFVIGLLAALLLTAQADRARAAAHAAVGKPVRLKTPANPRYPGAQGPASLTNGIMGDTNFHGSDWLGLEGPDLEATIDLGKPIDIKTLAGEFLQVTGAGIFLPPRVEFAVSEDGNTFRPAATVKHDVSERETGPLTRRLSTGELNAKARFVRVHAVNIGKIPNWHGCSWTRSW